MPRAEPGAIGAGPRRLLWAGALLGIGLGSFVDGIVFHQILQVHNTLSARRPPVTPADVKINMVWDGLFHAAVWAVTLAGVIALFRAGRGEARFWSGRALAGAMLMGWGGFNLVEGTFDHHLLHLHHVIESLGLSWLDWGFLGSGLVLLAGGWWLVRSALPERRPRRVGGEVSAACALMAG